MQEIIFEIIYLALYVLAGISRAPYAHKSRKIQARLLLHKKRELIYVSIAGLGIMIFPLIQVFSNLLASFSMNLGTEIRIIGIAGFAFAVFMHAWAHIALKTNWSPGLEIKTNHKLITTGPYRYIRHPMYTSFFLWSVFQGILLSNWLVLAVGIATFCLIYFVRIPAEEKMMARAFGKQYRDYMKKTGKIFPRIS
jgi:protein-S-isoprenylcysteine O-methyltransferase Ste14